MKFIRSMFIVLSLMLAFAVSGAFALMDCGCHDEHASVEETSDCACDCICCATAVATPALAAVSRVLTPVPSLAFRPPSSDGDSGRLTESFVFTPPRA